MKWCLMGRYVLTFPVPIVDPSVRLQSHSLPPAFSELSNVLSR